MANKKKPNELPVLGKDIPGLDIVVHPPVSTGTEVKLPKVDPKRGDGKPTGGNPAPTVTDNGMGSERTGA